MADNQWQWPSQDPRYGPPAGHPVPPPPAGYPVPPPDSVPPPAGYPGQAAAYHRAYLGTYQGGYEVGMSPAMRAASADRERTVDVLKAGFAEGRLTPDEYDERIGRAYAARTYGELSALIADLPAGAVPLPSAGQAVGYRAAAPTNSLAIAAMVLGAAEVFTFGLTAIPAVLCGHLARRQIRQTRQSGDGLATGGLVLGYLAIIFWALRIAVHGGL
jgi:Domain of unknown function (DUF1707)/Domain of unknown function (DUF4190)